MLSVFEWPSDLIVGLIALAVFAFLWLRRRAAERAGDGRPASTLVGPVTRAELEALPLFGPQVAQGYAPDAPALERLCRCPVAWRALVFVGTWCPDSIREVPRFLGIVDRVGLAADRLELIGLDRSKGGAEALTARHRVFRVPTFIVLEGDRELGRIVERPVTSLEGDLLEILQSAPTPV